MEESTPTELVELDGTDASVQDGMAFDPATGQALTAEDVQALSVSDPTTPAVSPDESPTEQQATVQATSDDDDPNVAWAKKMGVDPSDPQALAKLAKIARDNQRETRNKPSEFANVLNQLDVPQQPAYTPPAYQQPAYQAPAQPYYDQFGNYVDPSVAAPQPQQPMPQAPVAPMGPTSADLKMNFVMFASSHPEIASTPELEQAFTQVLGNNVASWAASPERLNQALAIAKAQVSESTIETRIEAARRDERERLTRNSALTQPAAQATAPIKTSSITSVRDAEAFMASHTQAEINERRDELESVLGLELGPRK